MDKELLDFIKTVVAIDDAIKKWPVKFENIDYFINTCSDGFEEICFYDSSKYNEGTAFGHELAIYPRYYDEDFKFSTYYEWMKRDGIKIIY